MTLRTTKDYILMSLSQALLILLSTITLANQRALPAEKRFTRNVSRDYRRQDNSFGRTHLVVRQLRGHVERWIQSRARDGVTSDNPVGRFRVVAFRLTDMETLALDPEAELAVLRAVYFLAPQRPQDTRVFLDSDRLSLGQIAVRLDHPRLISVEHGVVLKLPRRSGGHVGSVRALLRAVRTAVDIRRVRQRHSALRVYGGGGTVRRVSAV